LPISVIFFSFWDLRKKFISLCCKKIRLNRIHCFIFRLSGFIFIPGNPVNVEIDYTNATNKWKIFSWEYKQIGKLVHVSYKILKICKIVDPNVWLVWSTTFHLKQITFCITNSINVTDQLVYTIIQEKKKEPMIKKGEPMITNAWKKSNIVAWLKKKIFYWSKMTKRNKKNSLDNKITKFFFRCHV
jgi:hypothetical protein